MGVWIVLVVVVAIAAFVAVQVTAPARRRKAAVRVALERAAAAVAAAPGDQDARARLGRVQLELAHLPAEAHATLAALDAADPVHWVKDDKPTKVLLAQALVELGRLPEAIEVFRAFVESIGRYDTGGDAERKWQLETHKVEAEQRIRLLAKGDTHVHQPERWGDATAV